MEACGEDQERSEAGGAKELWDELIPAYAYILELLIKEAEEEERKAGNDEPAFHASKGRRFPVTLLHPRNTDDRG